jgi:tetratricopeptide (TPR) repeat protein
MVTETSATLPVEKFIEKNQLAEHLIASGDLPGASALLVDILDGDAANSRAYNNLGMVCWARKEWEDAFEMFRKSATLQPGYADALVNLFDAGLKLRRVAEVLPVLDRALLLDPDLTGIRAIRDQAADLGDSVYRSDRALRIGCYSAIIEEATRELEAGNESKALELFLKSNDKEGRSAAAYCGLGVISFYQNRPEDAISLFLDSIRLDPTDPDTFLNLLESAAACGKTALARELFDRCRREYPELDGIAAEFEMPVNNTQAGIPTIR